MAPGKQQMDTVNTPAKGQPAMEWLLWAGATTPHTATRIGLQLPEIARR